MLVATLNLSLIMINEGDAKFSEKRGIISTLKLDYIVPILIIIAFVSGMSVFFLNADKLSKIGQKQMKMPKINYQQQLKKKNAVPMNPN